MVERNCRQSLPRDNIKGEKVLGMDPSPKEVDEGFADSDQSLVDVESGVAECLVSKTCDVDSGRGTESESDPWDLPEFVDDSKSWNELSVGGKWRRVFLEWIGRSLAVVALLYCFICSLDFLSSAFRLLGGKTAGAVFSNSVLLQNPVAGLMIGVLATVLVQSSSTSTSIVVTMVASGIIEVRPAIPIIMGANIGTSVTNTIVSLSHSANKDQFRRAFAGATVHDMFNWMTVLVFLPIEVATGYLYHLTSALVRISPHDSGGTKTNLLKTITKPFTSLIIQLDKKVVEKIAIGEAVSPDVSLIKHWCKYVTIEVPVNVTIEHNTSVVVGNQMDIVTVNKTIEVLQNQSVGVGECQFLFHDLGMSDAIVGGILLVISLMMLCGCLVLMVKVLSSVLGGKMAGIVKKTLNANFPGKLSYFTGYFVMLVGAVLTMLVQSSSVFTSAVTPLVGVGLLRMERMYPLTLGANIGTTTTGLLAAMAASNDKIQLALQIALCHLLFNLSGIVVFYVFPQMRWPVRAAKVMGNTTAKYRWFAVFYLLMMFFLLPAFVFALSMAGARIFSVIGSMIMLILIIIALLNILQRKIPQKLPKVLRNWDFLPFKWMHSLDPLDQAIHYIINKLSCCCCCIKCREPIPDKTLTDSIPKIELIPEESLLIEVIKEKFIEPEHPKTPSDDKWERLRIGLESGYNTSAPTPSITPETTPTGPTPCVSRVQSCARIPSLSRIEELDRQRVPPISTSPHTSPALSENGDSLNEGQNATSIATLPPSSPALPKDGNSSPQSDSNHSKSSQNTDNCSYVNMN